MVQSSSLSRDRWYRYIRLSLALLLCHKAAVAHPLETDSFGIAPLSLSRVAVVVSALSTLQHNLSVGEKLTEFDCRSLPASALTTAVQTLETCSLAREKEGGLCKNFAIFTLCAQIGNLLHERAFVNTFTHNQKRIFAAYLSSMSAEDRANLSRFKEGVASQSFIAALLLIGYALLPQVAYQCIHDPRLQDSQDLFIALNHLGKILLVAHSILQICTRKKVAAYLSEKISYLEKVLQV